MENINGTLIKDLHNTMPYVQSGSDSQELSDRNENLPFISKQVSSKANTLKALVQFLVATIAPAKIYMMPHKNKCDSADSGQFIDLLLMISGKRQVPFKELEPILEMAYLNDHRVSCSLHSEGNIMEGLRNGHIFYSLYCTADNLVYDDYSVPFPITPPEVLCCIKQNALESFTRFFEKSHHFYQSAVFVYREYGSTVTGFLLHQAVELAYRAILLSLNGYDKKTHEIRVLKKYARRCAPEMNKVFPDSTPEGKRLIAVLDDAYLKARYQDQYTIFEEDLVLLFEKVKLLRTTAKEIVDATLLY